VIPNPGQQFHHLGPGTIVRAVIHNQHRIASFIGQPVEETIQPGSQQQQQSSPVGCASFEEFVGSIFTEPQFIIDHNATEEILANKRQCKSGHYQRTNTVPTTFSDLTAMHGRSNVELVEKVVDFTKNADVGLCLGGNAAMNHLSPFLLILLCLFANSL
jgi:hypothetical protein